MEIVFQFRIDPELQETYQAKKKRNLVSVECKNRVNTFLLSKKPVLLNLRRLWTLFESIVFSWNEVKIAVFLLLI